MPGERPGLLAGFDVPQLDFLIVTPGRERFAVGQNRQRVNRVFVPLEDVKQIAIAKVPLPHLAKQSGVAAAGKEESAVRGESDGIDVAAMTLQRAHDGARLGRAKLDLAITREGEELFRGRVGDRTDGLPRRDLGFDSRDDEFLRFEVNGWFGAGVNPGFDQRDLRRLELVAFARRHDFLFAVLLEFPFDHAHQKALVALAGNDDRAALAAFHQQIKRFHDQFPFRLGRAVAIEAMFREDRFDQGGVIRGRRGRVQSRGQCGEANRSGKETKCGHGRDFLERLRKRFFIGERAPLACLARRPAAQEGWRCRMFCCNSGA